MLKVSQAGAESGTILTQQQRKLKTACQEFEAAFLRHLLKKMRDTVPSDGLIERSQAQQTYQEMLDSALADDISRQGSLGLGEMLYSQLLPTLGGNAGSQAVTGSGDGSTPEAEK